MAVRRQDQTFSDRCTEVRELAGERWPDFSEQAPTLAGWRGGATPAQAFYIVGSFSHLRLQPHDMAR